MEGPLDEILYFTVFSITIFFIAPAIHEIFHAVVAELLGCSYTMHIGRMFGETELQCFVGYGETFAFLLSGMLLSFILSQLVFILSYETEGMVSLLLESFSAGVILSNAFSLFSQYNDITILGSIINRDLYGVGVGVAVFMIVVAVAEFAYIFMSRYLS